MRSVNNGWASRLLAVCGSLWIGTALGQSGVAEDQWSYTVRKGDTLIGISHQYLVDPRRWPALQRLNRVADPRRLQPGSRLRIPLSWLRADDADATVSMRVGLVKVVRDGTPVSADVGSALRSRDQIETSADSSMQIELRDGSRVLVSPHTTLTLTELKVLRGNGANASVLELQRGNTESSIRPEAPRPRYEIRTPVMSLGVRGTEFRAAFDDAGQRARAEVTRGRVAAQPDAGTRRVGIDAGFGTTARTGDKAIEAPRPLPAAPDLSVVPSRVERLPIDLSWRASGAAQAWRAQVFDRAAPPQLLKESRVTKPAVQWSELPDGDYRLSVRAIDAGGLEGFGSDHPFTVKARPEPPFTVQPNADGRLYGSDATWRWTLSSDAASYRLQVAPTPDFAAPVIDRNKLSGSELTAPLTPGRWYWRMASVRADGDQGPFGDTLAFEQRETPPPPDPSSDIGPDELVLRWNARLPGATFRFQLARDAAFEDIVIDRVEPTAETRLQKPDAGRYWLRAQTIDADGVAGPWGAPSQLDVPLPRWWWLAPALILLIAL